MLTDYLEGSNERTSVSRPGRRMIYLAAPYTDPDPAVRLRRYKMATVAAAALAAEGLVVFSPLTMTHPMDVLLAKNGETLGSQHWVAFDAAFMEVCTELRVLTLDGWDSSSGVEREISFFETLGRPISFISPSSLSQAGEYIT